MGYVYQLKSMFRLKLQLRFAAQHALGKLLQFLLQVHHVVRVVNDEYRIDG